MKTRLIYGFYNALLLLALPLIGIVVLVRWRDRVLSKGKDRWGERRGLLPAEAKKLLSTGRWWWVHAVSLGEVKAIESFLRKAPEAAGVRVLLSAVTPEALAWAEDQGVAECVIAAPLDLPWIVRRVFQSVRPAVFISVESEFWPNLLREAKRSGARVALINGRISARSFESYSRFRGILGALWEMFDIFAVRQNEDAERFTALGAPAEKIQITGNLKYDLPIDHPAAKREDASFPVVVFGSTREGEESALLPAIERLRVEVPQVRIIWAPRHIERIAELEALLEANGLTSQRNSQLRVATNGTAKSAPYVLWDSMGDLLDAYRQADVAVIGGSFVPQGGQNPIEPAALRLPVLFGPSMDNFKGVAENLVAAGGAQRVTTEELGARLCALLKDPAARERMGERARQAVVAQQGATGRTLQLLKNL